MNGIFNAMETENKKTVLNLKLENFMQILIFVCFMGNWIN